MRSQAAMLGPFVIVLGTSQDGGTPQAGRFDDPRWQDPGRRRLVASLGIVDPATGERWMIDATPDFREQLTMLDRAARRGRPAGGPASGGEAALSGVLLTHAHIGHYTGLMFLGHESMGANKVPVYAMPRMAEFLRGNGPWDQLVRYENIELRELEDGVGVALNGRVRVVPILVPHRQEYSEVVGFRVEGPTRSVLFIPDIDSWEELDDWGRPIEDLIAGVDVAYLDGTFFADGEIPGRDMSGFPHPFIAHSLERFASLSASERAKIRFIHLNHTNPAHEAGAARDRVRAAGMSVADQGESAGL